MRSISSRWSILADRAALAGSGAHFAPAADLIERASVTVVIPCYKYGKYLPTAVASALDQPGLDVEVIIVDDASPDDSGDVAERLAKSDPRVQLIRHAKNAGHLQTYNDGLAAGTGDYMILVSADDLLTPGALTRSVALMQAHPGVGLVYGRTVRFCAEPPAARTTATQWALWSGIDWLRDRCRTARNNILSPEAIMRTSLYREVGPYRADLPHTGDFYLWLTASTRADVGRVCGSDQALYRVHDTNMHETIFGLGDASGLLVDLTHRRAAIWAVFAEQPATASTSELHELETLANKTLAIEAIDLANRALTWGMQEWPVAKLVEWAFETYPATDELSAWRAYQRLDRLKGRQYDNRILREVIALRERKLSVSRRVRDWRWRQAGA